MSSRGGAHRGRGGGRARSNRGGKWQKMARGDPDALPFHERRWSSLPKSTLDAAASGREEQSPRFTLMSYNLLAASLVVPAYFPRHSERLLSWEYRRRNLLAEILHYASDIIALQEVDDFEWMEAQLGAAGTWVGGFEGIRVRVRVCVCARARARVCLVEDGVVSDSTCSYRLPSLATRFTKHPPRHPLHTPPYVAIPTANRLRRGVQTADGGQGRWLRDILPGGSISAGGGRRG